MPPPTWSAIAKKVAETGLSRRDGAAVIADTRIGYGESPTPVTTGDLIPLTQSGGALEVMAPGTTPTKRTISTACTSPAILKFAGSSRMDITSFGAREGQDCTTAIDAAMAEAANWQRPMTELGSYPATADGPAVYIPAGRYYYAGAGFDRSVEGTAKAYAIRGEHRGASFVVMQSDVYLLTTLDVNSLTFEHFSLIGGKGLWISKRTSDNVRGGVYANNLLIKNFTECAMGHSASDYPNIYVNHCQIEGLQVSGVAQPLYGLCFPGLTDEVFINNNTIGSCRYGIKLGRGGNNAKIANNGLFVRPHADGMSADIWLVPSSTEVNPGLGLVIENNKFGPEGIDTNTCARILVADDGAGTYSWQRPHSTDQSTGYCVGARVAKNAFYGNNNHRDGVIYSTTKNLNGLDFDQSNITSGWSLSRIVEYADPVVTSYAAGMGFRSGGRMVLGTQGVISTGSIATRPSNLPGSHVPAMPDFANASEGAIDVARGWIGEPDATDYVSLLATGAHNTASWAGASSVTSGIADPWGGTGAVRVDPVTGAACSITSSNLQAAIAAAGIESGALAWIETYVRSAGGRSAYAAIVIGGSVIDRLVPIIVDSARWRLVRIPITLTRAGTTSTSSVSVRLGISPGGAVNGQAVDFWGMRLYVAGAPVSSGHLRTTGALAGAWNGPHLLLGGNHLWVDAAGALRKKASAPTSDGDGALVSADAAGGAGGIVVEGALTGRDSLSAPASTATTLYTLGLARSYTHCLVTITILAWNNTAYLETEHRLYLRNNSTSSDNCTEVMSNVATEKGRYNRPSGPAVTLNYTVSASVVSGKAVITITPDTNDVTLRDRATYKYATPPVDAGVGVFEH